MVGWNFSVTRLGTSNVQSEKIWHHRLFKELCASYLKPKGSQFKYKLQSKNSSEYHIEHVQSLAVLGGLVVVLHGEGDGIDHDKHEDGILEWLRRDEPPHFVLDAVLRDIPAHILVEM